VADAVTRSRMSVKSAGGPAARPLVMFGCVFVMFRGLLMTLAGFFVVFGAFVLSHALSPCQIDNARRASEKADCSKLADAVRCGGW
jgi:hypothetical protein